VTSPARTAGETASGGDENARPALGSRDLIGIATIALQLVLVLAVVRVFEIENRTFFDVMALATAGFVVHALLPLSMRLPFFTGLSLASVVVAFGPLDGVALIALGLVLVGICHLPLGFWTRVLLLCATGALYAVWRAELLPQPWSLTIWPILASMFMFRIALYMHARLHDATPTTPLRAFAYFFMLPNVCFPLYPVVDYATFFRTHYDRDAVRVYETGVRWIVRGMIHLLLYRFVYLYLTEDPDDLRTLGDLVQFILATFLLYLRVSGQFHIVVGMLHLFGFRLPETHYLYYLASNFQDFWRRINIYWKDFMMKLVYYPSFFRLRRYGQSAGLVGATIVVFVVTWLLHSYQWFWLRGGFPLEAQDGLFWGLLGVLVVVGSLREMSKPRKRKLGPAPKWSLSLALRTVGTFTAICVLWSLWSADSVSGWIVMWMVAGNVAPGNLLAIGGLFLAALAVAGKDWSIREKYDDTAPPWYRRPAVTSVLPLLALLLLGTVGTGRGTPQLASLVASLQGSTLNTRDAALQHKGYYEKLDNQSRMSAQLWSIQAQKPAHWVGLSSTEAYVSRKDFTLAGLEPGARIDFLDRPLSVNRWGMRDRDYALEKEPGTYRIAILGPSHVMGSGLADGETFSDYLEEQLARTSRDGAGPPIEVLNFGIAGCSLMTQLGVLEENALRFRPDLVVVTDNPGLRDTVVNHVLAVVGEGYPIPYPDLEALVRETGVYALVDPGPAVPFQSLRAALGALGIQTRMPWKEARQRLRLVDDELVAWALGRVAQVAKENGAVGAFLMLDNVGDPPAARVQALDAARAAGLVVFDLLDVWQGRSQEALRIAPWDNHPNPDGSRIVARRLEDLMREHRAELRLESAFETR
jgi:D-alanyl-lipoteichoic acid acyltransferase DltB (MBOAT superfamily)